VPSDIAVIIAAYNAERTIREALESILNGTRACDVFIVDDASRIPVIQALGPLAARATIIRLEINRGPATARNVALTHILAAGYKYAAIMDADDIAHPTRLARQCEFLDRNPRIGVVGAWVRLFDDKTGETVYSLNRPADSDSIRKLLHFNIGMSHATAVFRVDALRKLGLYDESYAAAEDYELIRRIATKYDLANIPECLLSYRISPGGQSRRRRQRQLYDRLRTQLRYFDALQWRAWAGVAKTAALMAVPAGATGSLKSKLRGVGSPGATYPATGGKP
jgi:glycosyltransferase involved in cell wall biosynthesis